VYVFTVKDNFQLYTLVENCSEIHSSLHRGAFKPAYGTSKSEIIPYQSYYLFLCGVPFFLNSVYSVSKLWRSIVVFST